MPPKSVTKESIQAEHGLVRAKWGVVALPLVFILALMLAQFVLQQYQDDRANKRLDKLEQSDLPAKSAERDREFQQNRRAICTALAHETRAPDVLAAERAEQCSTVPATPSSTPPPRPSASTSPGAAGAPFSVTPSVRPSTSPTPGSTQATRPAGHAPSPTRSSASVRPSPPPPKSTPPGKPTPTPSVCLLGLICLGTS